MKPPPAAAPPGDAPPGDARPTLAPPTRAPEALDAMAPISLEEMDQVALMNRVDTKFVLSETDLGTLLSSVRADYRVLSVSGSRVSPYATLYFDTPDRASYLDHHNGRSNRHKFRIREYVSSGGSFLEVKTKSNKGRTSKKRVALPSGTIDITPESVRFLESVIGSVPRLQPQLWTHFSRITLTDNGLSERVTLDLDVRFSDPGGAGRLDGLVIAEVKQGADSRVSPVREGLRQMGVRPMRISKYCLGSLMLDPSLKRNRFKSKLLALRKIALGGL